MTGNGSFDARVAGIAIEAGGAVIQPIRGESQSSIKNLLTR